MAGDNTFLASEDYVEEAWRIVEPVLIRNTPIYQYAGNACGPDEVERVSRPDGWHNPRASQKALTIAGEAACEQSYR